MLLMQSRMQGVTPDVLNGLPAEHASPAARRELKRLWGRWMELDCDVARTVMWQPLSGRVRVQLLLHTHRRGKWSPQLTPKDP